MTTIRKRASAGRILPLLRFSVLAVLLLFVAINVLTQDVVARDPAPQLVGLPLPPGYPHPQHLETGVRLIQSVEWGAGVYDNDYTGLTFDLYLGTTNPPPLKKAGIPYVQYSTNFFNQTEPLPASTKIYWRVVSKNAAGEASSPVWMFTTAPNTLPITPHDPLPPDNAPGYSSNSVDLKWSSGDADHHLLVYDFYFGTDPNPPLVASDYPADPWVNWPHVDTNTTKSYPAGPFVNGTQYYWRVVARDPENGESSSPVWTFVASDNEAPVFDEDFAPSEGETVDVLPAISWTASDPNLNALTYKLYLGTTNPPPLYADNLTSPSFPFCVVPHYCPVPPLLTGSTYYWYVVANDGGLETASPTHSFETVPPGDVTLDGNITVYDAICTLHMTVLAFDCSSRQQEARARADVNCDGMLTPADARCIHKNAVDGSCTFCSGGTTPARAARASNPLIQATNTYFDWDTLKVDLSISNLPSLKSFGMSVQTKPYLNMIRVRKRAATGTFEPLNSSGGIGIGPYPYELYKKLLVGYTLGDIDCTSETQFLELSFYVPHTDRNVEYVKLYEFLDDLAGAPDLVVNGTLTPVLFSSFVASPRAGFVDVAWKLESDEAMDSYTLYRRDGSGPSIAIANGTVDAIEGSYRDTSVKAGKTYDYELVIRTTDGDDFRSPVATVSMPALALTLHQNVPNPFNPQTTIRYDLPSPARVRLMIVDVAGRHVRTLVDELQTAGSREAIWTGRDDTGNAVSSGVYFYVLDVGKERLTRKLVLLK